MRTHIPNTTITNVLIKSRRRCCFCFGWQNDHEIKLHGQIAHLDRNSKNNKEDNLAYLCLEHHDDYDSKRKECKNLTLGEVKKYRDDLYEFNKMYFDPYEVQEIVFYFMKEKQPITFRAIRRYVYVINCSDTRPAETMRQIEELVRIGALIEKGSGEYIVNINPIDEV